VEGQDFEMNGEARRGVELARRARTPGDADTARVRAAVPAALGGAAVVGAASSTAVASAAKGAGIWVGARALLATVLLASAGAGTYFWARAPHGPATGAPAPAATTPAPTTIIEPLPPAAATAPAADPLLVELTLLRQAQRALRDGDARRAL